jgi:quinol monooxygenase YgiN
VLQLLVRLVAPQGSVEAILSALRTVSRPAHQARGCSFAQVYQCPYDAQQIEYVEEWDNAEELRGQLDSERFRRLLALLEMAADRPVLEFRVVSDTHGLEFIASELINKEPA